MDFGRRFDFLRWDCFNWFQVTGDRTIFRWSWPKEMDDSRELFARESNLRCCFSPLFYLFFSLSFFHLPLLNSHCSISPSLFCFHSFPHCFSCSQLGVYCLCYLECEWENLWRFICVVRYELGSVCVGFCLNCVWVNTVWVYVWWWKICVCKNSLCCCVFVVCQWWIV